MKKNSKISLEHIILLILSCTISYSCNLVLCRCEEVIGSHPPRFASEDKWRSSHFGAHPRQIIFSDPTMVQTYDLRVSKTVK